MKYRNNNWITKHNIHIFDNRWSKLSVALCIPLLYLEDRYLRPELSKTAFMVILIVSTLLASAIFAQIIGSWWHKRYMKQLKSKGYKI